MSKKKSALFLIDDYPTITSPVILKMQRLCKCEESFVERRDSDGNLFCDTCKRPVFNQFT